MRLGLYLRSADMSLERTPNLSKTALLRYLSQIFKTSAIKNCREPEDAIDTLNQTDDVYVPEGLDAECALIYERLNVRGSVWALSRHCRIAQIALELGDGYFLISDENTSGAESLFLCASSISDTPEDMHKDLGYIVSSWCSSGCPTLIMGGYKDKKVGGTVHVVAAQLCTLV